MFRVRASLFVVHILLVVFVGFWLSSCSKKETPPPPDITRPVKLMKLDSPGIYKTLTFPARIKAFQEVNLSFLQPGRIEEIPVKRGQTVKKEEVLAKLDPKDFENRFNAAMARSRERSLNLRRMKEAFEKEVATEVEVEQAQRDYEITKADEAIAKKALNDTVLRAPFAGEIGWQFKEVFQDVAAKETIFRLQDVTKLKVIIDVPESVLFLISENKAKERTGNKSHATFDDLPEQQFPLKFFEAEQTADPTTKTYAVTFLMKAPRPGLILPGMSATLHGKVPLPTDENADAFAVPVNAVISGPGSKRFAWVQDPKTGRVSKREVTVGAMEGDDIQILTGLKVGETIATSGANHLREGMKVSALKFQARRAAE